MKNIDLSNEYTPRIVTEIYLRLLTVLSFGIMLSVCVFLSVYVAVYVQLGY